MGATIRNIHIGTIIKTISIHAPARGATQLADSIEHVLHISIRAPAMGATPYYQVRFANL